jgi:hypothetical protein
VVPSAALAPGEAWRGESGGLGAALFLANKLLGRPRQPSLSVYRLICS